ncbi:UNVERIFIED_CONTAM: hypothetical protein Sradi_6666700 [Sesamum radiatum]|uniref:Uncharacterized protein n=1 Tax=Sesamum radiatum TaxID=300843 RepID=A0AAW2JNC9_SESRA
MRQLTRVGIEDRIKAAVNVEGEEVRLVIVELRLDAAVLRLAALVSAISLSKRLLLSVPFSMSERTRIVNCEL